MKYKVNILNVIEWLFVIVAVLNCHSVYSVSNLNINFEYMAFLLAIILLLIVPRCVNKYLFFCVGGYLFFQMPIIFYAFTISNYAVTYIFKYVLLFIFIFLLCACDWKMTERLIQKFCKIMFVLALVSLIFYICVTILNILPITSAVYLEWYPERWVDSFMGIYFEVSPGRIYAYNNSGIFAESPIYAAILCIALTFELFIYNRKYNYTHIIIFYITLLSTFSTTANIYIVLSVFGIVFVNYEKLVGHKSFRIIFGMLVWGVGMVTFIVAYRLLMDKKNAIGMSYSIRLDDYAVAFKALRKNVLLGVGFGNTSYSYEMMSSKRVLTSNLGQSSDFAALLASGGLYFMLIYVLGLIGLMLHGRNKKAGFILFSLLVYIFIVSRVGATILFMVFICAGLCTFARRKLRLSSDSEM